jgi:hypothetical protein
MAHSRRGGLRHHVRIDRRVGNLLILYFNTADFRDAAAEDMALAALESAATHILLRQAPTLYRRWARPYPGDSAGDVQDLVVLGVEEVLRRVVNGSMTSFSQPMEIWCLQSGWRRLARRGQVFVSAEPPVDDQADSVAQPWGPEWLELFWHLLLLSRRCFAYIRGFVARDRVRGWIGRLSELHLGPNRNSTMSGDLREFLALMREVADAYDHLDKWPPTDPVERLLWDLSFTVFGVEATVDPTPATPAGVVAAVIQRLPCESPHYPRITKALRKFYVLRQQSPVLDLVSALEEFRADLRAEGATDGSPAPPSPLVAVLEAVGPGHRKTDSAERSVQETWGTIRGTRAPADLPATSEADSAPPRADDVFRCVLNQQPLYGPHQKILVFARMIGGSDWLEDVYRSLPFFLASETPNLLPDEDLGGDYGRLRDWQDYLTRLSGAGGPNPDGDAFRELPRSWRNAHPKDLDPAVREVDQWCQAANSRPAAWTPHHEPIQAALVSLYLQDLHDDMTDLLLAARLSQPPGLGELGPISASDWQ